MSRVDPRDRVDGARGQAFSMEAIVAAVVVLGGLVFALQVGGVTALTASTSSGQVLQQQEAIAEGILDAALANGSLRPTLLYWDEQNGSFYRITEVDEGFYTTTPPTAFGTSLNETVENWSVTYNVALYGVNPNGSIVHQPLVRNGVPSDDAAWAVRTVTLYDDTRLLNRTGSRTNTTLENASFYLPDRFPDGPLYNVVRVEVTVWPV